MVESVSAMLCVRCVGVADGWWEGNADMVGGGGIMCKGRSV